MGSHGPIFGSAGGGVKQLLDGTREDRAALLGQGPTRSALGAIQPPIAISTSNPSSSRRTRHYGSAGRLRCFDAATGRENWRQSYPSKTIHQWLGPRATPTMATADGNLTHRLRTRIEDGLR